MNKIGVKSEQIQKPNSSVSLGGLKERLNRFADVSALLDAGISVVAINYQLVKHAVEAGIKPSVKVPLYNAARALPYGRSKVAE